MLDALKPDEASSSAGWWHPVDEAPDPPSATAPGSRASWRALLERAGEAAEAVIAGGGDPAEVTRAAPWEPEPGQDVAVRFGRAPDGRLIVTGLIVGLEGEREITSRHLRSIPLGRYLEAAKALARDDDRLSEGHPWKGVFQPRARPAMPVARGRRKTITPEFLAGVAKRYREVCRVTDKPIRQLAEEYSVSEATIRRWHQRARDRGLLGPAPPGKAGELRDDHDTEQGSDR
jgi:hypothetical protein